MSLKMLLQMPRIPPLLWKLMWSWSFLQPAVEVGIGWGTGWDKVVGSKGSVALQDWDWGTHAGSLDC